MKTLDHVFLGNGGPADPFYANARDRTLLISADCTRVEETCFCAAFGLEPYCDGGADLNLTELDDGILLTVLSERGRELVSSDAFRLSPASSEHLEERDARRAAALKAVQANVEREEIPLEAELDGAVDRHYEDPLWREEAARCVECGACNTICPTCHCFLLVDRIENRQTARYKAWDSCLLRDFARVAGGHNPRPQLYSRLRNRFVKKFSFFPKITGMSACTGCGRCIAACPAQIDIRRILKRIVSHADRIQPVSPR